MLNLVKKLIDCKKPYEDVKLFFFGPSEKVVTEDKEIKDAISNIIKLGVNPYACVNVANAMGVTLKLKEAGFNVLGIGKGIADSVNAGYVPIVF